MSRRISVSIALAITIIAMTVTFSITWLVSMAKFDNTMSAVNQLQSQYAKLAEIDTYVRGNYYKDIDDNALFDRVAAGYMAGLGDRYSTYYTEREYTELVEIQDGVRVGVGLEVMRDTDGNFTIARVYDDSPAAKAGVTAGGRLQAVNGKEAASFTSMSALRSELFAEEGEELALDVLYNVSDSQKFTVRHSNYKAPTVETIVVGDYAYIRVNTFDPSTEADFDYCLRQAQNAGVKGIVFDVRGTSGGYFRDCYRVIDLIAPYGAIAKSVNKTGVTRELDRSDDQFVDLPMVALVDNATSGPAELFAISVREMCGGAVVGRTTAGRGTMQSLPQRLSDGSAISVTTAMLLTGQDTSFDTTGILPDVVIEGEKVGEAMLLAPKPDVDPEVLRAFEVVRALVRERGGDPGETVTPGTITDSAVPPQDDSEANGGADSDTGNSLPDNSTSESIPPASSAGN